MDAVLFLLIMLGLAILVTLLVFPGKKNESNSEELKNNAELKRMFGHWVIHHRGIAAAPG
jgi:hypothetical protein